MSVLRGDGCSWTLKCFEGGLGYPAPGQLLAAPGMLQGGFWGLNKPRESVKVWDNLISHPPGC